MDEIECWRDVVWFEGAYSVSSHGRVRSNRRRVPHPAIGSQLVKEKILRQTVGSNGYAHLDLNMHGKPKTVSVHSVVAEAFIGALPPGMEVAHCDGNKANNKASNLRHATPRGNNADRALHGTDPRGERNPAAVLSADDVRAIRLATGRQSDIAKTFGICPAQVSNIIRRVAWSHVA